MLPFARGRTIAGESWGCERRHIQPGIFQPGIYRFLKLHHARAKLSETGLTPSDDGNGYTVF
ncbi:hypothetical protein [Pantoea ananatis]|uniref:hypothetical protein n=1 Tax=Pantoea ananas TaxID=553 RepID=UPI00099BDAA0|nr:hypothetical protein [Pantoea ananatis]SKA77466.1 hypothetical protein SAMN03097719_3064 [Pantoea ananatis]